MGDKIKDRKLGSQEEKNMSRLLIKIIWFILGVAALFYGIKGIYFCFTGGTVETLDSSSDGVGGFFGLLWCFYYIGIGLFVLIGIKEIREKKKKKNETEENKAEEKEEDEYIEEDDDIESAIIGSVGEFVDTDREFDKEFIERGV